MIGCVSLSGVVGVISDEALVTAVRPGASTSRPSHHAARAMTTANTPIPIQSSPRFAGADIEEPESDVEEVEDGGGETAVCSDTG